MTDDDELVEMMAEAIRRAKNAHLTGEHARLPWLKVEKHVRAGYLASARAALAVAEPVIRERCRHVAVTIAHQFSQDDPRHETGWAVADAIRTGATP